MVKASLIVKVLRTGKLSYSATLVGAVLESAETE